MRPALRVAIALLSTGCAGAAAACISIPELRAPVDASAGDGTGATQDAAGGMADASDAGASGTGDGDAAPPACAGQFADVVKGLHGLLAYWRLDEDGGTTAHDAVGHHDGTYHNVALGVGGLVPGDPDTAAGFDPDAGSYVEVPYASDLDLSELTLGALVRPNTTDVKHQIICRPLTYWLQLDPPSVSNSAPLLELGFIGQGGSDQPPTAPSYGLAAGAVALVVGAYDGSVATLYVDGRPPAVVPVGLPVTKTTNELLLGSWDKSSNFHDGVIDEAFIAQGAISGADVQCLWQAAQGAAADAGHD